jgi:S1-C subfamily serine protease
VIAATPPFFGPCLERIGAANALAIGEANQIRGASNDMRRPVLVLAMLAAFGLPAAAQNRVTPENRAQIQLSFAGVVKEASPAVVNVYGARVERRPNAGMDDFFRRYFGEGQPGAMPQDRVQRSLGSGVIVDASGLVVTNNHVVENMTEVKVALTDRREFEAEIVLRDPRTDLAVLRLKGATSFPTVGFGDSEALEVGDLVLAIGNPFGVGQTVTQGIVSALARTQVGVTDYQFFIQTDAPSIPATQAGRSSTWPGAWSASTRRSSRARGAATASASRSPPAWCARSWIRPKAAAGPCAVPGSAPACRP